MGLDVTAYSKLQLVEILPDVEAWESKYYPTSKPPNTVYVYAAYVTDTPYSVQLGGALVANGVYSYDIARHFRAGSYSGYNRWREQLSNLALQVEPKEVWSHSQAYRNQPFASLIDFSDCEGWIAGWPAKDLGLNFKDYQIKADKHPDAWFRERYTDWRNAFALASDGGAVKFS